MDENQSNVMSARSNVGYNERVFLADFINYKPETSGGRLAKWLQPDSFVDVNKCEVILPRAKIKCGWPTSLAIVTRDQYGDIVEVPDLKVNVECLPLIRNCVTVEDQNGDADGGEKIIDFSMPYKPVIVNQVRYNAIIFMQEFTDFSFEEIRYMTPTTYQEGEKLSVVANHNGIYTATWTPKEIGFYSISVTIDGYPMNEVNTKIEVKMPPHGAAPPPFIKSAGTSYYDKKLQFSNKFSAGLRVRAQPSLQSEQIGIIMKESVVTYVDEFENEDGFWIKLSHDSIAQYCKQLFSEAWCLRYNKHYECELLSLCSGQTNENQTEKVVTESEVKIFKVVKCGVSGHNIRAYPSLKAPTVGMIYAEQKVTSDEQIYNKEGMWIRLDKEALKTFNLTQYDNVWSLAVDKSQIVYLRSDFSMNKDMFLNALKWDALSNKITQSQSICNTSTSEDSDNDHNHNYFIPTTRKKLVPSSKEDAHIVKKPSTSRSSKSVTPNRRANVDDVTSNTSRNQNLNFSMPPPTPKKQRRTTAIVEIEKSQSTCSSCVAEFNDSSFSSSSSDSVGSSERSQFYSFIDKLEKRNEPVIIGVSAISDKSSAISSGYQASIDTSSDSVLIFKPDPFIEQEQPPTLAQACTQTSPKLLPRIAHFSRLSPDIRDSKIDLHFPLNANVKVDSSPKMAALVQESVENVLDEAILQVEASEHALVAAASRRFEKYVAEANPECLKMSQTIESAGASSFNDTMNNLIGLQDLKPIIAQPVDTKDPPLETVCRPKIRPSSKRKFDSVVPEKSAVMEQREDGLCDESTAEKDSKKIKYKTGMSPSAAESIRAVFAAFLWHEGLVHDAMTCASFLRFYPELVKDRSIVVRRMHSGKTRNPSQRYSVEVGLTGNAHHLIKPSTMESLPSANRSTPPSVNENGKPITVPKVPPMTLEHVLTLWNEISNTCLQIFSKGTMYSTATYKVSDLKFASELERGKTLASKFANDFYTKFATEDICELCNEKFPFPITSHMSNAHMGCGKAGVSRAYNVNGKYNLKVEGYCGDGGRKNSPWYILCEGCREQFLHAKTLKSNTCPTSSPVPEESATTAATLPSSGIHLILKENALFALDLSGSYNKLTPAVSTLPRLKSFSCLASFGIDGDSVPNEMSSLAFETAEQELNREENGESDNEEATNVVNNFQRSVSRIGRKWKSNEDNNRPSPEVPNKRFTVCEFDDSNLPELNHSSTKLKNILKDLQTKSCSGIIERPIMAFLCKYHNLQCLKSAMKLIIRNAIYKNFGLRAFDWLLHTVTAPMALHDIMWWFVASFSIPLRAEENYPDGEGEWNDEFDLTRICEHPLVDMALAGEARQHIPSSFHTLLQTIADLMLIFPVGSPLQQMAIKCWGFQFTHSDYSFLHRSKLFVNISKILSRSESEEEQEYCTSMYESHPSTVSQSGHYVEVLRDVTPHVSLTVSSQNHLIHHLTDNSTETYWESSEEDRRKMKTIVINSPPEVSPYVIYIHVDNTRDTNHKVSSIMILTGTHVDNPRKLRNINLDADYCGWVTTFIPKPNQHMIRVDCKGDAILRVRQVKITGELKGESPRILQMPCSFVLQQRQCESETLKVFRLIIFQVFGELIENYQSDAQRNSMQRGSSDLKEHMVGILFSRRKLNNLQKQVCTHIVQTIKRETCVIREEWERHTNSLLSCLDNVSGIISDSYCFEMLCMVSALSGSDVGRSHLAQQLDLISDLLALLHVGTTRLQRQVILLLKRVLPEVSPERLAQITGVQSLPAVDFRALASKMTSSCDAEKCGILDIFLSVIAKIVCVQVKAKNGSNGKDVKMVVMSDFVKSQDLDSTRWYLKGNMSRELAAEVDSLMKDMSKGKISDSWQEITKAAIAENILNLANLSKLTKDHKECLKYPTFWIGLASLSIVDGEHVEKLSSANWRNDNGSTISPRPLCANHDDGKTAAVIQCNICGLLCLECDRFLHLNRKTSNHERRVCKEEEEAIKVDVHEGCGRVKLFWLLALVDSNTFKGVVEFRENSRLLGLANRDGINSEICRFCGRAGDKSLNVCCDEECQEYAINACNKVHRCGHLCGGIKDEENCLPCLHGCSSTDQSLKQDADDMCMICFTEALSAAPSIQLECGHVFHYHCCRNVLIRRRAGPRITFNFQQCPICKRSMRHDSMLDLLSPIWDLMKEVRKKALMRLEYEGCPSNYEDPAVYAMEKYAYYMCFKCKKAYYGGEARCEAEVDNSDYNPEELICGGCSDISGARVCPKHGTDFLEYKCRYCCSVAVYFCFGTTHFCNACHEDFQKVISMLPSELPVCPAGPKGIALNVEDCPLHIKHPPTGEEFALGCGVCRTGRNF